MNDEHDNRGRWIGEQIDAFDRAVRRRRIRRAVIAAPLEAGALALLSGLLGLAVSGVDVMVRMAALGFFGGLMIGAIVVSYEIYRNRDDDSIADW